MTQADLFVTPSRRPAASILADAIAEFDPSHVFALFSGGHDSLCSTHIASQHPRFSGCAHINTGIGVEETRSFVRQTCASYGWPLKEYHPPISYDDIVLKHGFPGPAGHLYMYSLLKERCVRALVREHKTGPKDRVVLVTGVRSMESARRMGHVAEVQRFGAQVWVAPIVHWSGIDKEDHIEKHQLPRNPVVGVLCMSGECLCGAYAKPEELSYIEMFYPAVADRIRALQAKAAATGVHAQWGVRPPKKASPMPMCWSCEAKGEAGSRSD